MIFNSFQVDDEFLIRYTRYAELSVLTGRLNFRVTINHEGSYLLIQGYYDVVNYELLIENYSYVLIDKDDDLIVRADSSAHHHTDYRKKQLINFPHHIHDSIGRLHSFSGEIKDFVDEILKLI